MTMSQPINVLFVCTGNSCRSQMGEGWARTLGEGLVHARSAGIEAHGQNPRAIAAMGEVGIDISGQSSDRLTDADLAWADLVVTVCGHADEHCPLLPPDVGRWMTRRGSPAPRARSRRSSVQAGMRSVNG